MNDTTDFHLPSGPLDPIAAAIADYFRTDPIWRGLTTRPLPETRAAIKAATPPQALRPVDHVENVRVPRAGGETAVRIYRAAPRPRAVILWAHGGGFALGDIDDSDGFARALTLETECVVASIEYRLAPEHRFPAAIEDVLTATQWVAERCVELAGANVPVVLGGDSAGANLATVVTRKLHEMRSCSVAGNVLAYPCTDNGTATSLTRFEPPFLKLDELCWFLDQYLPDHALRKHPDFAPLNATNMGVLPPTLIITAEHDILTEQAEEYGRKLQAAGVHVRTNRHPGMIHGFLTMDAFFAGAAGEAMHEIRNFISHL